MALHIPEQPHLLQIQKNGIIVRHVQEAVVVNIAQEQENIVIPRMGNVVYVEETVVVPAVMVKAGGTYNI